MAALAAELRPAQSDNGRYSKRRPEAYANLHNVIATAVRSGKAVLQTPTDLKGTPVLLLLEGSSL